MKYPQSNKQKAESARKRENTIQLQKKNRQKKEGGGQRNHFLQVLSEEGDGP